MDLVQLMEKYGQLGGLGIGALTVLFTLLKSDKMTKVWEKIIDSVSKKMSGKKKGTLTVSDITNHDIFNHIDYWTYSKIPTYAFSSEYRNVVFRKYLTIYLRSYKRLLKDLVVSGDYRKMERAELWKTWLDTFNRIVREYETECRTAGIPEIVISKMKEKNNESLQLMIELSNGIIHSGFYDDDENLLRVFSIMNIILSVIESTIINAEKVGNSINGELRGLSMDGHTEP